MKKGNKIEILQMLLAQKYQNVESLCQKHCNKLSPDYGNKDEFFIYLIERNHKAIMYFIENNEINDEDTLKKMFWGYYSKTFLESTWKNYIDKNNRASKRKEKKRELYYNFKHNSGKFKTKEKSIIRDFLMNTVTQKEVAKKHDLQPVKINRIIKKLREM